MGIKFKKGVELDHLDKINMFYARGRYTLHQNPLKDLSDLYSESCGLSGGYYYGDKAIMEIAVATMSKLDLNQYRLEHFFMSLFSEGEPGFTMGCKRPEPIDAVTEILSMLRITHVNEKQSDGTYSDIVDLGKIEDNKELLEFIK